MRYYAIPVFVMRRVSPHPLRRIRVPGWRSGPHAFCVSLPAAVGWSSTPVAVTRSHSTSSLAPCPSAVRKGLGVGVGLGVGFGVGFGAGVGTGCGLGLGFGSKGSSRFTASSGVAVGSAPPCSALALPAYRTVIPPSPVHRSVHWERACAVDDAFPVHLMVMPKMDEFGRRKLGHETVAGHPSFSDTPSGKLWVLLLEKGVLHARCRDMVTCALVGT